MKVLIINGPNLNLLGTREPEIYGGETFATYFSKLQVKMKPVDLAVYQSNHEGDLVTAIQNAAAEFDGIVLNAAAYTHTSVAIGDAVKAIATPVVEVHISNVFTREEFRHHSFIAPNAIGVIAGFGLQSYELAVRSFLPDDHA